MRSSTPHHTGAGGREKESAHASTPQRDALLQAVIERANLTELLDEHRGGSEEQKQSRLATLPEELSRFGGSSTRCNHYNDIPDL